MNGVNLGMGTVEESFKSEHLMSDKFEPLKSVEKKTYYPLTPTQKRLFQIYRSHGQLTNFNQPNAIKLDGYLNFKRFSNAVSTIIERHDSLRTSFEIVNGEPVQRIWQNVECDVSVYDLSADGSWDSAAHRLSAAVQTNDMITAIIESFVQPFDLSSAPLLHVGLINISDRQQIILFDLPPIIADQISMELLIREILAVYNGLELPELSLQYQDFVVWQDNALHTGQLHSQEMFWRKYLSTKQLSLLLPTDYPNTNQMNLDGDRVRFEINRDLTERLNLLAEEENTTLEVILLTIYMVLLYRYSHAPEVIIGMPMSGRNHPDLHNVLGLFMNLIVLKSHPTAGTSFQQFLQNVTRDRFEVLENQDYPFEKILEMLDLHTGMDCNRLCNIAYDWRSPESNPAVPALYERAVPYEFSRSNAKFELTLKGLETVGEVLMEFEYRTSIFKRQTVERIASQYVYLAYAIVQNPYAILGDLPMLW